MGTHTKAPLPSQKFGDRQIEQLQREVNAVLRALQALPFAQGCVDLGDVTLTATTAVAHKLGRVPRGWLPYAVRGASFPTENARDAKTLTLAPQFGPCTFGLLVW